MVIWCFGSRCCTELLANLLGVMRLFATVRYARGLPSQKINSNTEQNNENHCFYSSLLLFFISLCSQKNMGCAGSKLDGTAYRIVTPAA